MRLAYYKSQLLKDLTTNLHTAPVIPTSINEMGAVVRHNSANFQPFNNDIMMHPRAIVELYTIAVNLSPMPSSSFMRSLFNFNNIVNNKAVIERYRLRTEADAEMSPRVYTHVQK